jgi:hypothetical protein
MPIYPAYIKGTEGKKMAKTQVASIREAIPQVDRPPSAKKNFFKHSGETTTEGLEGYSCDEEVYKGFYKSNDDSYN